MKVIKIIFTSILLCAISMGCGEDNTDPAKNGNGKNGGGKNDDTDTPVKPKVGQVLPDWSEGYLDIHAINTGRGESTLYIFPDGTTMLVDAASAIIAQDDPIPPPLPKPNATADPAQTIINYVSHFIEPANKDKLNYLHISHWDGDHVGSPTGQMHSSGKFDLFGITRVGASIPFETAIDRGHTYPRDITALASHRNVASYVKMTDWAKTEYSATREEFKAGALNQIALRKNPSKYSNFQIRNIAASGVVWTGSGTATRNTFPENVNDVLAANPAENIFSCAFHLKYGMFDYFSGGDMQYQGRSTHSWFDIEAPVAQVVSPVEVMKANHHATNNCNSDVLLSKLKPHAVIAHVWRDVQPHPDTIKRMFDADADCQIFTTNLTDKNKGPLGMGEELSSKIKGTGGHIVVRVEPGGHRYSIYVLNDTNENYIVSKIFGPYQCN